MARDDLSRRTFMVRAGAIATLLSPLDLDGWRRLARVTFAGDEARGDDAVVVRQGARGGVLQALTARGRDVVAAPPDVHLLVAELLRGFRLVEPLQRAVVALVQPPRPADGDPLPVGRRQRELGGRDGPLEHRRVQDVGQQVVLGEELTAAGGFLPALDDMASPDMPLAHYRYMAEAVRGCIRCE